MYTTLRTIFAEEEGVAYWNILGSPEIETLSKWVPTENSQVVLGLGLGFSLVQGRAGVAQ